MTTSNHPSRSPSVFTQAAKVFDGWNDPETGLRVLRVHTRAGAGEAGQWSTIYHQFRCFLDGGRKVLLDCQPPGPADLRSVMLDLTTGKAENPFPPGWRAREVVDGAYIASMMFGGAAHTRAALDMRTGKELAGIDAEGWTINWISILHDNRRAIVVRYKGKPYGEKVHTRQDLLTPGEPPRQILDADGFLANHVQGCPSDPELYSYDRWPSPMTPIDQGIHIRTLDGRHDEPMKMDANAARPGDTAGARDHYVWTPDSRRIVSYYCPHPLIPLLTPGFNHFKWEWWLSATDWRTGEDLAAKYPPGRFGGHMQMSPDSKQIVCCGGPGFDKLFVVDMEGLRNGWNERVLCTYPTSTSDGTNADPFPMPFVLPDQSGVIFNAGWPGEDHGVYLCEWPKDLR